MKNTIAFLLLLSSISISAMDETFPIHNKSNVAVKISYTLPGMNSYDLLMPGIPPKTAHSFRNNIGTFSEYVYPNKKTFIPFVPSLTVGADGFSNVVIDTNNTRNHLVISQERDNIKKPGKLRLIQNGIIYKTLTKNK